MSLIKCPECNKQVSTLANTCPNCGAPIAQYKQSQKINVPITVIEETSKELKLQLIYSGIFTVIAGIILFFVLLSGNNAILSAILLLIGACWMSIIRIKIWWNHK